MADDFGLARRLRTARSLAGLTIGQAAKVLGLELMALAAYETGQAVPPADLIARLARAYDVAEAWLAGQVPETLGPDDPLCERHRDALEKLSPEDREKLLTSLAAQREA